MFIKHTPLKSIILEHERGGKWLNRLAKGNQPYPKTFAT